MRNTKCGTKLAVYNLKNVGTTLLKGTGHCICEYLTCRRCQNLESQRNM